jgi:hypothetical protein
MPWPSTMPGVSKLLGALPPPEVQLVLWGEGHKLFVWGTYLLWTEYGRKMLSHRPVTTESWVHAQVR